jgi:hypothetical protein
LRHNQAYIFLDDVCAHYGQLFLIHLADPIKTRDINSQILLALFGRRRFSISNSIISCPFIDGLLRIITVVFLADDHRITSVWRECHSYLGEVLGLRHVLLIVFFCTFLPFVIFFRYLLLSTSIHHIILILIF